MHLLKTPAFASALVLLAPFQAHAQDPAPEPAEKEDSPAEAAARLAALRDKLENKLEWKTGTVELPNGLATLKLDEQYRFLATKDARFVLEDLWGNPPSQSTLGLIFPADMGPVDTGNWAVVVTYEEDGHINDDDASSMKFDEMLKEMQEDTQQTNKEREEAGFAAVTLVGWAEPPHYDATAKKLYWAKELAFSDSQDHTLNYNIRALGRKGVLVLNAVADLEALPEVKAGMAQLLPAVEFNQGHRYADFDPKLDKVAAYGIGALIAGKLASKVGLLAGMGVLLLKAKKLLIVGGLGLAALVRKLRSNKE